MKEKLIVWMVQLMLDRLNSDEVKMWIDQGLDMMEDAVASSPNKYDDMIVLPLIKVFREATNIPDND